MLDLTKKSLPDTVDVGGRLFNIKTDFRVWLQFAELLKNPKNILGDFDFIYDGYKPADRIKGFNALFNFYSPYEETPHADSDEGDGVRLTDFNLDGSYIYSAFMACYKIDLIDIEYLHWHKFLALFTGLKNTFYNDIIGFRGYKENTPSYEQSQRTARERWALPYIATLEENETMQHINERFN